MDIKSIIRLTDGKTSYQVCESIREVVDRINEVSLFHKIVFIPVNDRTLGEIYVNAENIVSISGYSNEFDSI